MLGAGSVISFFFITVEEKLDKTVMKLLGIKTYPERILRKRCEQVEEITADIAELFRCMLITMYYYKGIGLAAPQVGVAKSMIVADIGDGPIKLANPVIIKSKGKEAMTEGCLSIPGVEVHLNRGYEIVVRGLNDKAKPVEVNAKGLMARVLQHETDHLNGKLIIDYLPFWKRVSFKAVKKE